MIPLTDKLYKQVYKVALHICYSNKDNAAICTNQVLLNLDKYKGGESEQEFWGWARTIIKNKNKDLWRCQKNELVDYYETVHIEPKQEETNESFFELIEAALSPEEYNWCLSYFLSTKKKNVDKCKFYRLKEKVLKAQKDVKTHYYLLTDIFTGQERKFFTKEEIAKVLKRTKTHIHTCLKDETLITKRFRIQKINL
jgi:hypothetical protein